MSENYSTIEVNIPSEETETLFTILLSIQTNQVLIELIIYRSAPGALFTKILRIFTN